jgi:hypothetical protein
MRKYLLTSLLSLIVTTALAQGFPQFLSVTGTPQKLKAGPGVVTMINCASTAGTDYLVFWDVATAPTPGTTVVVASFTWVNTPLTPDLGLGFRFLNGLYVATTLNASGGGGAGTTGNCTIGIQ